MIKITGFELIAAMNIKLYIATEAMKAIIANPEVAKAIGEDSGDIAAASFKFAEAIIKEYNKGDMPVISNTDDLRAFGNEMKLTTDEGE